jgi:addiction module HigA family antidote
MKNSTGAAGHPGTYVRQNIFPSGMTVKEAAERLSIGRPALSNFLNGNSSLSPKMAVRLERAFGANRKQLLEMQANYDQQRRWSVDNTITVRAFIPSFLTIKARQIEDWADSQIDARSRIPVLLRKLVHSTGSRLEKVDFPGFDNAQRKGSDGFVQAAFATPWIPEGDSYWEFGTDKKPGLKAESDYSARLISVDSDVRAESTFVFVTPRNWHAKADWERLKNEAGDWKSVRAFDASDLEQWLEQSVPAQIWLAEQLVLTVSGYETLEQVWNRWTNVSEPKLTQEIFTPSIAAYRETFRNWLQKPSSRAFVVSGDSRDEALAFLACLFDDSELRQFKDITAVFTSPDVLRILISSSATFIPIVYSEATERELIDVSQRLHCIIYRPRNAIDMEADIKLDLLSHEAFKVALTSMGVEDGYIDRLARESGRSPTILRRRLSQNAAIKKPEWAGEDENAKLLVPITLIGAWHSETESDRKIVSNMAGRKYEEIEVDIARLLRHDDCPVWSIGHYRGLASKLDALFAISRMMTPADLNRFFIAAEYVLSEIDPALELPEKDRWAATFYEKTRDHSSALRTGICETLVILSVHGNQLFQSRLGIDVEGRVAILIRKLLIPFTLEKLLSHNRDLPRYAEAAPNEFLKIIEEDLYSDNPIVFGLLKPVDSSLFGVSPSRTGLLWGLECLAWKPQNLPRVCSILARLSHMKIDDNWANKPAASLQAIFRSWMPQTAASVEQRIKILEMLIKRFPDVGWQICIEQIKPGTHIGHYSYRPDWRGDASGVGQVVTQKEMYDFNRTVLDFLIAWKYHDEKTLGDLVEALQIIPEEDQTKIWDLIDEWSKIACELSKASLRERIRQFAFTRRSRHRKLGETIRDRARDVYDRLRPGDPVIRHGWLFADHWVQESIEDEDFDYRKREEQIDRLRLEAMYEIWNNLGFEGIKELVSKSDASFVIGRYASLCVENVKLQVEFIQYCLSFVAEFGSKAELCLQGFLSAMGEDSRTEILQKASRELNAEERKRLFVCAPFQISTWRLLEGYDNDTRTGYWKNVFPSWGQYTSTELTVLMDCLLDAGRPRAAFHAVHMNFADIETSRLKRLLFETATVDSETVGHFMLNSYYISEAMSSLDRRIDVTRDEMAQLEFLYLDALGDSEHGIKNLERQIAESPILFVQAVTFAYKRRDDGEDPPEWRIQNPEKQKVAALSAYRLLNKIKKIPGTGEDGKIDTLALIAWLTEVRRLCHEFGRAEIGDHCLGQLLAKAPVGGDDHWPCEAVCEAMERVASPEMGRGFHIGVHNSRGVHSRGEGGEQERELAAKYYAFADRLYFDYPYVGGVLEDVAKSYEHEAKWEDSKANLSKRLLD